MWEEAFLLLCVERLKSARVEAVWLCDREFRRVARLLALKHLRQDFVVRLQANMLVELEDKQKLLREIELKPSSMIDLGSVRLRIDKKVKARVIGVWAKESEEIWWLATNLELQVVKIVQLYDRLIAIEEQF